MKLKLPVEQGFVVHRALFFLPGCGAPGASNSITLFPLVVCGYREVLAMLGGALPRERSACILIPTATVCGSCPAGNRYSALEYLVASAIHGSPPVDQTVWTGFSKLLGCTIRTTVCPL